MRGPLFLLILLAKVLVCAGSTCQAQGNPGPAVAEIEKLGGRVYSDPSGGASVSLAKTKVRDSDLRILRDLTDVRILYLNDTGITDAGLEHVRPLSGLKEVYLENTDVTQTGANDLKKARPGVFVFYKARQTGFQAKTFLFALLFMAPTLGIGFWFMRHSVRARQRSGFFPANIFVLGLFLFVVGLVLGGIGILRSFGANVNLANLF